MSWLDDRNREQILGMQELLVSFSRGKISLQSLVHSLTGKQNGMVNVDPKWSADFERHWLKLEICNALFLEAAERNEKIDICERQMMAVTGLRQFLLDTLG